MGNVIPKRTTNAMEWQQIDDHYTLQRGTCEATVWPTAEHGYGAMVRYAGMSTATYGHATLEAAQAWCLTELAKARRAHQCGEA